MSFLTIESTFVVEADDTPRWRKVQAEFEAALYAFKIKQVNCLRVSVRFSDRREVSMIGRKLVYKYHFKYKGEPLCGTNTDGARARSLRDLDLVTCLRCQYFLKATHHDPDT